MNFEHIVTHTIHNYQLTSRLKQHRRLKPENGKIIAEAVVKQGNDKKLLELLKKRDQYNSKIFELLNSAGEQENPALIVDRAEAEHYIRKRILRDRHKVASIKTLIKKHTELQKQWKCDLEQIQEKKLQGLAYKGLAKLNLMNADLENRLNQAKTEALQDLYGRVSKRQQELSEESERTLRSLGVPFFSTVEETAAENKVFVLELLQSLV